MHSQHSNLPRDAPYPFNQPSGDVTLRTSDTVHFHIHTQILSQASPVFATMFALPQPLTPPDHQSAHGDDILSIRPVVDVTEESQALEPLLRVCYPVRKFELQHLDTIQSALEAAIKYDMEWPTEVFTARLLECAAQGPLQVWAFGCRHGLEHVARRGAEVLRASLSDGEREKLLFLPNVPRGLQVLDGASAGQYFRLLEFSRTGDGNESVATGSAGTESLAGATGTHSLRILEEASLLTPPKAATALVAANVAANRALFELLPFADVQEWPGISEDLFSPDIICRCEDGTEFKAHQIILSLYSPILRAQIAEMNASRANPQSPQWREREGEGVPTTALPVLDLDGPSSAISRLLGICYHNRYPQSTLVGRRSSDCIALAVATKYKIQRAIDLASVQWEMLVATHPHLRYFIARKAEMRGAAAVAARAALKLVWEPEDFCSEWLTWMEDAPARTYHQLALYFDACSRAAARAVERATKAWEVTAARGLATAGQSETKTAARMYQHITNWLNRRREALERLEVAPKADHARDLRIGWSPSLGNRFNDDFEGLLTSLPLEIDMSISKVKLDLR